MRGHIRRRGKSSWAIVIELERAASGRRRQKWHSLRGTKREAERELARLIHEMETGAYVEPSRLSVAEYLEIWLCDSARPNVAPKTYERYEEIVRSNLAPGLGHHRLEKLRPLHIQGFYTEVLTRKRKSGSGPLSAQSVLHFHRVLHRALGQAVKWQLLARNPVDAVEPPRPERKEIQTLTDEELIALLRHADGSRVYMPILLGMTTGLRRGEILGLRWQDIDLEAGQAKICQSLEQTRSGLRFKPPKSDRSRRQIALPQMTVDALMQHKRAQREDRLRLGSAYADSDLVITPSDGQAWPPNSFSSAFQSFIRRSDLPRLRFHDLRHCHATQLLRAGIHPKVVSERLGHSKIGVTLDIYSHVMPGMQDEAARSVDRVLGQRAPANRVRVR